MNTQEYLTHLESMRREGHHPEFDSYASAWMRSRQPEIFKSLAADFKFYEGEIYAAQECNLAYEDVPF